MYISLALSRTSGFKKWSGDHQTGVDADQRGGATPVGAALPLAVEPEAMHMEPHCPWRVPGTGASL
jgi:hypothetical protein